jgi:hypothetical protein
MGTGRGHPQTKARTSARRLLRQLRNLRVLGGEVIGVNLLQAFDVADQHIAGCLRVVEHSRVHFGDRPVVLRAHSVSPVFGVRAASAFAIQAATLAAHVRQRSSALGRSRPRRQRRTFVGSFPAPPSAAPPRLGMRGGRALVTQNGSSECLPPFSKRHSSSVSGAVIGCLWAQCAFASASCHGNATMASTMRRTVPLLYSTHHVVGLRVQERSRRLNHPVAVRE